MLFTLCPQDNPFTRPRPDLSIGHIRDTFLLHGFSRKINTGLEFLSLTQSHTFTMLMLLDIFSFSSSIYLLLLWYWNELVELSNNTADRQPRLLILCLCLFCHLDNAAGNWVDTTKTGNRFLLESRISETIHSWDIIITCFILWRYQCVTPEITTGCIKSNAGLIWNNKITDGNEI